MEKKNGMEEEEGGVNLPLRIIYLFTYLLYYTTLFSFLYVDKLPHIVP